MKKKKLSKLSLKRTNIAQFTYSISGGLSEQIDTEFCNTGPVKCPPGPTTGSFLTGC